MVDVHITEVLMSELKSSVQNRTDIMDTLLMEELSDEESNIVVGGLRFVSVTRGKQQIKVTTVYGVGAGAVVRAKGDLNTSTGLDAQFTRA